MAGAGGGGGCRGIGVRGSGREAQPGPVQPQGGGRSPRCWGSPAGTGGAAGREPERGCPWGLREPAPARTPSWGLPRPRPGASQGLLLRLLVWLQLGASDWLCPRPAWHLAVSRPPFPRTR